MKFDIGDTEELAVSNSLEGQLKVLFEDPQPPLRLSIQSLEESLVKNRREADWKLVDIGQWEEEIKKARVFVEVLEERNTSIKYAIKVLEGAEDERGNSVRGEDANDCKD